MRSRIDWIAFIILLALPVSAELHGDKPHGSADQKDQSALTQQIRAQVPDNDSPAADPALSSAPSAFAAKPSEGAKTAPLSLRDVVADLTLSDFPTLHPMVVHVPVTFIPAALLFSLFSLFSVRRQFIWLTLGFAGAGLLGGLVAAFPLHPHAVGLSETAKLTLQKHDLFAYSTLWLVLTSVALASVSVFRPITLVRISLSAMLLLSTIAVVITAHYGGTLAYVHGVGVQGQFLSNP